jgi:hypothetical protein
LGLVAAFAAPGLAHAQSRFTDQRGIYSFDAPAGWTPYTDRGFADVVYDAPGGASHGIIVSLVAPTERTLADEITAFTYAYALQERRPVTINGMPCEFASGLRMERDFRISTVLCLFYVPFSDGDARIEFSLMSTSPVASADWQLEIFWQVANSIKWGAAYEPAP